MNGAVAFHGRIVNRGRLLSEAAGREGRLLRRSRSSDHVARELKTRRFSFLFLRDNSRDLSRDFFLEILDKRRGKERDVYVNGSELSGCQNDRWWKLITSIYRDPDKGDRNERNSFRSRPRQPFRHSLFLVRFRSISTRSKRVDAFQGLIVMLFFSLAEDNEK